MPGKITDMTSAGTLTGAEYIEVVSDPTGTPATRRTTVDTILSGQYTVNTIATSGATETLPATYPAHKVTMDQSCTFAFDSPTKTGHTFLLWLLGAFTPTFPASVDWDGGSPPTYIDDSLYGFTTLDGGATWLGSLIASGLA